MKVKVTKEIEQKDVLDEVEQEDLFFQLLNGNTVSEEIETSRGKFTVKFPKQKDLMFVDRRIAAMRGGLPASSFDDVANFTMQKIAYLDVVVSDGEPWFNKLKEKNASWSWGEMPDVDFVEEVYVKAYSFRLKVQNQLKRNEEETDTGASVKQDVSAPVDNGLFSGVAKTAE